MLLLAPASRNRTLDIIAEESFEVDVMFLMQRFNMYLITLVLIQKSWRSAAFLMVLPMHFHQGWLTAFFSHLHAFSSGFM